MTIVNLQGKYVPVKVSKGYTVNLDPKVDPDTGQPVGDRLDYQYGAIIDSLNNVYFLPLKDNNVMFTLTDIVEAASGNQEKIKKIYDAREYLCDTYCADLLGQEWQDYLYDQILNDSTGKTVKAELEEETLILLKEDVVLPDHVSDYEQLAKNSAQLQALIASARLP